jgi:V-type H+-transporting ATPase subunit B
MKAVIGEEALSEEDRLYLEFLNKFENQFLKQGPYDGRDIFQSLDIAWQLLRLFPEKLLKKITPEFIEKYYKREDHQRQEEEEEKEH